MEWSEATIENDGFSMVLGQPTIGNDGFSMVGHHWSNDGMVTYHRRSLAAYHWRKLFSQPLIYRWILSMSTTPEKTRVVATMETQGQVPT